MRAALPVIAVQLGLTVVVALVTFSFSSASTALSAGAGCGLSLLSTLFFSLRVFGARLEFEPQRFLRRFYRAEIQKIALTVFAFYAVASWTELNLAAFLIGFAVATTAYWLSLPLTNVFQHNSD